MSSSAAHAPSLLGRAHEVARLRHLSSSTEDSYLLTIRRFIRYHEGRHPRDMGVQEIRAYLSHLAIDRNVAASNQNAALPRTSSCSAGGSVGLAVSKQDLEREREGHHLVAFEHTCPCSSSGD